MAESHEVRDKDRKRQFLSKGRPRVPGVAPSEGAVAGVFMREEVQKL